MSPLEILKEEIEGIGHPDYPFLHAEYSIGSKIPCQDFTGFIIERLKKNDLKSIYELDIELSLGDDYGTKKLIKKAVGFPFEKFIAFDDPEAYFELRAMCIFRSGRADNAYYVSRALSCYHVEWLPSMTKLINRYVKETHHGWLHTEADVDPRSIFVKPIDVTSAGNLMRQMTVGARIHMLKALDWYGQSHCLPFQTNYDERSFGLYIPDTTAEILQSLLFFFPKDVAFLIPDITKVGLVEICEDYGIEFKKSWTKTQLGDAIANFDPVLVEEIIRAFVIAIPNPKYADELNTILAYAKSLENPFRFFVF